MSATNTNTADVNYASLVSLNNAAAGSDSGYLGYPLIEDPSSFSVPSTGEQQNLGFLEEPYNPSWPDSKKNRWYEYNIAGVSTTPAAAAKRTLGEMEARRTSASAATDPMRQAEMSGKKAEAAAAQLELQEAYRQEVEYQRSLATINNPKATSAEWNAARMQMDGLAAAIGRRINPKGGTSQTAMRETKNAVGYIGALESKNPFADFGPRIDTMLRGSQERMGLIRQQMEAAGVPVPEMAPAAAATQEDVAAQMAQAAIQKRGLRGPDGNLLTIAAGEGQPPQPIVARMRGGKKEYRRVGPDGLFYPLTADQIKQLGLE